MRDEERTVGEEVVKVEQVWLLHGVSRKTSVDSLPKNVRMFIGN